MKRYYLLLIGALLVAGCHRPSVDDPNPVPVPSIPEPPLVEMQTLNDSLFIDSQLIYTRTASTDVSIGCRFGIVKRPLTISRIREVGFCLSPTDSVLSIRNPQHIRLKAALDTVSYQFTAAIQTLMSDQNYFVEPYFIMQDGRVYYGRYVPATPLQTPSWLPRPPMNAITRFSIKSVAKSIYKPVTITGRASVPLTSLGYDFYHFISKDKLYVLSRAGNLFQYDADQDKWVTRQRLKIEPVESFNGWPAIVFGVNDKGYVLYSDALFPNPTFYWEYDPDADQWNKLNAPDKLIVAPYQYTYQRGNQVFLSDTYQKKVISFDATQKQVQPATLPNLLANLTMNKPLLTGSSAPYAYYATYDPAGNGQLFVASYDDTSDQFAAARPVSDKQSDLSPTIAVASATDILFGLGYSTRLIRTSRINTELLTSNDDMIRYSTATGQLTARYDLSAIRAGNNNYIWATYKSFRVGNRLYVIDATNSKMWEMSF